MSTRNYNFMEKKYTPFGRIFLCCNGNNPDGKHGVVSYIWKNPEDYLSLSRGYYKKSLRDHRHNYNPRVIK